MKFSRSELQGMIKKEVESAMKVSETKLVSLLEKIEHMEDERFCEDTLSKLEEHIERLKRRGDAAIAYLEKCEITGKDHPQKKRLRSSSSSSVVTAKVGFSWADMEEDTLNRASYTNRDNRRHIDDGELSHTMETTKKALKKMYEDNEVLKAALADLNKRPTSPTRSCDGASSPQDEVKEEEVSAGKSAGLHKEEEVEQPVNELEVEKISLDNSSGSEDMDAEKEGLSYPPLPSTPFPSILNMEAASYNIPQRPCVQLALIKNPPGLSVLWNVEEKDPSAPPMESYSVFMAVEEVKGSSIFHQWKTLGEVKAIPLPMCVMISKYKPGYKACFAVVGKDKFGRYGPYSKVVPAAIPDR
ncbi:activating transcription factor 7-interacting protein 2 [Lampris incognitus]|uniref:activating transcription factor 7-interacting protein 2 n=1 Tax=Lampris incognitus TaxID=2546036 RepID=UPI0024B50CDE|nr:activating transcription factor 7-interacting protein 2 [Lampris incognitus]